MENQTNVHTLSDDDFLKHMQEQQSTYKMPAKLRYHYSPGAVA